LRDNIPWCYYDKNAPDYCKDSSFNWSASDIGFTDAFYDKMYNNFTANLNVDDVGAVVASRDNTTPGGSYFYNWMRDGALCIKTYQDLNNSNFNAVQATLRKYVSWVRNNQGKTDKNNDVRIEPKFEIPSGEPYTGGWCRPQTDGPGLRANSLSMWTQTLLNNDGSSTTEAESVWELVKHDLDWVTNNWTSSGCDLWEEVRSDDFFWGRSAFVFALKRAASVADAFVQRGVDVSTNSALKSAYLSKASEIGNVILNDHYKNSYIYESTGRQQDGAVIHAIATFGEHLWKPNSTEAAATISKLNKTFCNEYPLNQADNKAGEPGILIGRYPGDSYAGGNPWQLLTAALAETFYLASKAFLNTENSSSTFLKGNNQENVKAWMKLLNISENDDKLTLRDLANSSKDAGDAVMSRLWKYVKNDDGRIDEQIDKSTGAQKSAKGLTWSYANLLHAIKTRKDLVAQLSGAKMVAMDA